MSRSQHYGIGMVNKYSVYSTLQLKLSCPFCVSKRFFVWGVWMPWTPGKTSNFTRVLAETQFLGSLAAKDSLSFIEMFQREATFTVALLYELGVLLGP